MERDVYRDDLVSNREPHMEEPRSTASYIRETSRPVGESPFLLAVAIAAAPARAVKARRDRMDFMRM